MDTRSIKRNYQLQQWRKIIQEQTTSGLTIDGFCKQNGLSRNSYFYWLRLVRVDAVNTQQNSAGFVELKLPDPHNDVFPCVTPISVPEQENSQLTLSVNGIVIQVTDRTSSELLARTIEVIRYVK